MASEKELIAEFVTDKITQMRLIAEELGETLANTEPTDGRATGVGPVTNSVVALLTHSLEVIRFWSGHVNLGTPMKRDRPAEFVVKSPLAPLFERVDATLAVFARNLEQTTLKEAPANLQVRKGQLWPSSCRGTLWHLVEETSQHLGHAELTRDILVARATTQRASDELARS